jgi:hypothetical protein
MAGHESKGGIIRELEGDGKERGIRKRNRGAEHDQSTLYVCMKMS